MNETAAPIRVMLVDDHKAILWGLQRLVESAAPAMEVVATAASSNELLAGAKRARPHVVLLDLDLNGESSLASLPYLRQLCEARVLILTGDRHPASHRAAISAGARGVVLKDEPAEVVLQAIEHVHAGGLWLDQRLMDGMLSLIAPNMEAPVMDDSERRIAALTARERSIIRTLLASPGARTADIAALLQVGEHTLRNQLSALYEKLGVRNRIDLFAFASEHGLGEGGEQP
ncbi:response regulator transcription factor [Uliginosibacterium aquaticum]|uniref:Response regulator transcription factor n=1 Tax=Uliginosibacterium aquaticum TaxID=2731212 RepID=A0ABX2IDY5_9RHOO|nr:response regulator transcription factor [Uliginosibacterium aquaticum]NSL54723.1 response regulator transcription factor [Uliginosibacterium aquaticum]